MTTTRKSAERAWRRILTEEGDPVDIIESEMNDKSWSSH